MINKETDQIALEQLRRGNYDAVINTYLDSGELTLELAVLRLTNIAAATKDLPQEIREGAFRVRKAYEKGRERERIYAEIMHLNEKLRRMCEDD